MGGHFSHCSNFMFHCWKKSWTINTCTVSTIHLHYDSLHIYHCVPKKWWTITLFSASSLPFNGYLSISALWWSETMVKLTCPDGPEVLCQQKRKLCQQKLALALRKKKTILFPHQPAEQLKNAWCQITAFKNQSASCQHLPTSIVFGTHQLFS